MTTRQEKIEAIQKEIANKSLLCRECKQDLELFEDIYICESCWMEYLDWEVGTSPVMIGDVLDWIDINFKDALYIPEFVPNHTFNIVKIWKQKRLPLEDQEDECIDYIFNLVEQW